MGQLSDRRDNRRLFVGPDYAIRFSFKGRSFTGVRITNISAGGCFAVLPRDHETVFTEGGILDEFALEHSEMPHTPFFAQIRYVLGGALGQSDMEYLGLGIAFMMTPEDVKSALSSLLEAALGPE